LNQIVFLSLFLPYDKGDFQLLSSKLFIFQLLGGLEEGKSLHTQSDGFEFILLNTPINAAGPPAS
jgi:hypothetical protein